MTSKRSFQNTVYLREPGVASFPEIIKTTIMLIKQTLKTKQKSNESQIMYQNVTFIFIFRQNEGCYFWGKLLMSGKIKCCHT